MTVITDYIKTAPADHQPMLNQMYQLLKEQLPDAEERISYGMPTFYQYELLVHFIDNKHHIGLYPAGYVIKEFALDLEGYQTTKGSIHFEYDHPLPEKLIKKIVTQRLNDAVERHTNPQPGKTRTKRQIYEMPKWVKQGLSESNLTDEYQQRPAYQRNDYMMWITQAKREETRQKRYGQMIDELKHGDVYMKMAWHPRS